MRVIAALPGYNASGKVSVAAGAFMAVNVGGSNEWTAANVDSLRTSAICPRASLGLNTSDAALAFTYTSSVGGTIGLGKFGGGTLIFSGSDTYSGPTTIAGGTLQLGNATALQNSTVVLSGGVLNLNGYNATLGGLSGSGNLSVAGGTLAVGNNGASTTYSGVLGGGALQKIGSGWLLLAGSNTYTGGTLLNTETLAVTNAGNLGAPSGPFAVSIGPATLEVAGNVTSGQNIYLTDPAATIQVDPSFTYSNSGVLSGNGGLSKTGGGTLTLTGLSNYAGTTWVHAGVLQVTAGSVGNAASELNIAYNAGETAARTNRAAPFPASCST